MVTSNETRNHEAQFARNYVMEKLCFSYFKLQFLFFCLRGIHFDMDRKKTNSGALRVSNERNNKNFIIIIQKK